MKTDLYREKARGMLLGLAVGDALGAPVEFGYSSRAICELGDKISHFCGSMILPAGAWTDDTSMALCIADSLIGNGGYDSYDIMDKFSRWVNDGYRSFDGKPAFDVGTQTANAIELFSVMPIVEKDTPKTTSAGNGAIMRLAPIIIANVFTDKEYGAEISGADFKPIAEMAILSCRETHNSIVAECVTCVFAMALFGAMIGLDKSVIRAYVEKSPYLNNDEYDGFWHANIKQLISDWHGNGDNLKNLGGYIVDAFAIAMWGFINSGSFEEGIMKIVRLGGDTDTNAAIYGQLAGAYYGYEAIPEEWRDGVYSADELVKIADQLLEIPRCPILRTRFEDDKYFRKPEYY